MNQRLANKSASVLETAHVYVCLRVCLLMV